ncbi:MAG: MFS transporter [Candidatus Hodarchaeota archaeon]
MPASITVEELLYGLYHFPMAITAPFISWYFFTLSGGDFLGSGLIITIPYIFLIFSTAIFGRLSDKLGSKKVVQTALAFYAMSFLCYYLIGDTPIFFFLAYIGFNIIISAFIPAFNRLISFEEKDRAERFGKLGMTASFGFLVGSLVVSLLIDRVPFLTIFLMAAGVSLLPFLLAFRLKDPTTSFNESIQHPTQLSNPLSKEEWDKLPVYLLLFLFVITQITNSFFVSFFAIFTEFELKQPVNWVGIVNTVATLLGIGGTYSIGKITQKIKNKKPLVVLALILYPLLPFCVFMIPNPIIVFTLYSIPVYSIFFVLIPVFLSENSLESERGRLMGFYSSSQYIGLSIGTIIGAILASYNGVVKPNFLVATLIGLLGLMIGVIFFKDPSQESSLPL